MHFALVELPPSQKQPPFDMMQFGRRPALPLRLGRAQRLVDKHEGIGELSSIGFDARQHRLHVRSSDTATGGAEKAESLLHESDALLCVTRFCARPSQE